jgi:hypothetical protein
MHDSNEPAGSMREEARLWAARSLEAMRRSKRESLDDYARPGRATPHWLDNVIPRARNAPAERWEGYPVVYRLADPDGRVVCTVCFHEDFSGEPNIEHLPAVARHLGRTPQRLFDAYCLALGPYAFKLLFGDSLVCNHCERVVTAEDVHVCQPEGVFLGHLLYVLNSASGILPSEFLEEMADQLFDRAVYKGIFRACTWHSGCYVLRVQRKGDN